MGMTGISKSQVSRLCAEIDEKVQAFLNRPIEGDWPYLWIDATYVKVRQSGRIVSVAVIVAVGVNSDGRREVLGMAIGPSEAETFWTDFLRKLARRGLRGVKLVISDAHEGIKAAIAKVLHATWQRCRGDDGRPGIDPEVAVRLMLAGLLTGIVHDRKLMREAHVNIAIRWFAGYALHEKLPDHSSLTRIRQRWGEVRFRRIFKRTVEDCLNAKIATAEVVHIEYMSLETIAPLSDDPIVKLPAVATA
jgi:transposase